ncbi:MAG: ABC transporter ATP-binding protein [Planctomycetaceae bacterium]
MSHPVITVENLGKRFQIGTLDKGANTLRETLMDIAKAPFRRLKTLAGHPESNGEFWAIRNLSFEVQKGDVLGIIGRNGAGKSTLLKLLSRISDPTEGRAVIRGRVASLLEVGTGFHNELTGRENVYLNGAILGMRKTEIDRKFDEIVEFSGVEKFLDTPIKRYSSGMKVRLAFSVAAHLEPEILIIDEVLAVGDHEFQQRCLGKMQDAATSGRTVLFVSHNMAAVRRLCNKAIRLERGQLIDSGPAGLQVDAYTRDVTNRAKSGNLANRHDRTGDGRVRITNVDLLSTQNNIPVSSLGVGQPLTICIDYEGVESFLSPCVHIAINNELGVPVIYLCSRFTSELPGKLPPIGRIYCRIPEIALAVSEYTIDVCLKSGDTTCDHMLAVSDLSVTADSFYPTGLVPPAAYGAVLTHQSWSGSPPTP